MIYLSSFTLPENTVSNPNAYPYRLFRQRRGETLFFDKITVLYGDNGCGKSTLLNLIATGLGIEGAEAISNNPQDCYAQPFLEGCRWMMGEDEDGKKVKKLSRESRYIKSEDILYEIKKTQQESVLQDDIRYRYRNEGYTGEQLEGMSKELWWRGEVEKFAREKYSNGEISMQIFEQYLVPDALYLLDEPETSLSPVHQVQLANQINELARLLRAQFIIATHSPFLLGTLQGAIYDLDQPHLMRRKWSELENIRYFYHFFQEHDKEFEN